MYAGDSFFSLSEVAQSGLVALTALLGLAAVACVLALFHLSQSLGIRMTMALVTFWVALWLFPQIYYFYYQIILDELTWQFVISAPPRLTALIDLLLFDGPTTLANHAKGIFGWILVILGLLVAAKARASQLRYPH